MTAQTGPQETAFAQDVWMAERLEAWAGCVRRLIAVAPTRAIVDETGVTDRGHSTPPERAALRAAALETVDRWLQRDLDVLRVLEPRP